MKTLLDLVADIADVNYGGHVSVLKFTTGWKVVFRTPSDLIHSSAERELLDDLPGNMSLDDALLYALTNRPSFEG